MTTKPLSITKATSPKIWPVPLTVTAGGVACRLKPQVSFDISGAQGGPGSQGIPGGKGGRTQGTIHTVPGTTILKIQVGSMTPLPGADPTIHGGSGWADGGPYHVGNYFGNPGVGGGATGIMDFTGNVPVLTLAVAGGGGGGGGGVPQGFSGYGGYGGNPAETGHDGMGDGGGHGGKGATQAGGTAVPGGGGQAASGVTDALPAGTGAGTAGHNPTGTPLGSGANSGEGGDGGDPPNTYHDASEGGGGGGGGFAGGGGGGAAGLSFVIPWPTGGGGGGLSWADASVSPPTSGSIMQSNFNSGDGRATLYYTYVDAPFAPTLKTPADGSATDLVVVAPTFDWTYQPGPDSGTQSQWSFVRQDGGGESLWWGDGVGADLGPGWSSFPVVNTGTSSQYTFPGPRTDHGCTVVGSGSHAILDSHITAADAGKSVSGLIPYGLSYGPLYVDPTTIVPGTSFTLSSSAVSHAPVNVAAPGGSADITLSWWGYDVYQWTVATAESIYDTQGGYAATRTVYSDKIPDIVYDSPQSISASSTPQVTFHLTDGTWAIQGYRICVYNQSDTTKAHFVPGGLAAGDIKPVWDSGQIWTLVGLASLEVPQSAGLLNKSHYAVYSQATIQKVTGVVTYTTPWTPLSFRVLFDAPQTGLLQGLWGAHPSPPAPIGLGGDDNQDPDTGQPINTLVYQANDNLVHAAASSFEGSLGGADTGDTDSTPYLASAAVGVPHPPVYPGDVPYALDGVDSLAIQCNVAGDTALRVTGLIPIPNPGEELWAIASFLHVGTAATCDLGIKFYNPAGTPVGTHYVDTQTLPSDGAWHQFFGSCPAASVPLTATQFSLIARNENMHINAWLWVDCVGCYTADPFVIGNGWSLGGFVGNSTASFQWSPDLLTWYDLPNTGPTIDDTTEQTQVSDYWAPHGVTIYYRACTVSSESGQIVSSDFTPVLAAPPLPTDTWWFLDPTDPVLDDQGYGAFTSHRFYSMSSTTAAGVSVTYEVARNEIQGQFQPYMRQTMVVVGGKMLAEFPTSITFAFEDQETYARFDALRNRQIPLLVKSDMPGEMWYLRLGNARPAGLLKDPQRKDPTKTLRSVVMTAVPVDPPAGFQFNPLVVQGGGADVGSSRLVSGGHP